MNQGILELVKQEMARVNTDILGISKLNGLEWVNLTQMTIISTTVSKNPLEERKTAWLSCPWGHEDDKYQLVLLIFQFFLTAL